MEPRDRQVAENEVRFRALNERLRETGGAWQGNEGLLSLVCECGEEDCMQPIRLTPAEYESVRAGETQFAMIPDHVHPEFELMVSEHDGWALVRKRGEAAAIAAASDPRSD